MTKILTTDDFDYSLDPASIAQHPLENRAASKMMHMDRDTGKFEILSFDHFEDFMLAGDVLVLNETKVIPARLFGARPGKEEKIEVLLLKQERPDVWECLVKPGKKMKVGSVVHFGNLLTGEVVDILDDGGRLIHLTYDGIFEEVLDALGEMPLPPYITERLEDKDRYQTVYAKHAGSAAAPTAGLHFTPEMLVSLREKGVRIAPLTLHVGLGTFRPVKVHDISSHKMHEEWYHIDKDVVDTIQQAKKRGNRIFAVGTTSLRVLETIGEALLTNEPQEYTGWTALFVTPGFSFHVVDALLTNFHLPKSTLMMLVSAFSSREFILHAYEEAQNAGFRFFSFGDCMLLTKGFL